MLPALIGTAAKLALPEAKKVAESKAKKVAVDKFFGNDEEKSYELNRNKKSSLIKRPSSSLVPTLSKDFKDTENIKADKPKDGVKTIFEKIGKTLGTIVRFLKYGNQTKLRKIQDDKKQYQKLKNTREENRLEKKEKEGTISGQKIPGDEFGIGKFFKNIILGSVVLAIVKNIKEIVKFFKEIYDKIKLFIEKLGEFIKPIWDFLKWVVVGGVKLTNQIRSFLGIGNRTEDEEYAEKIGKLFDDTESITKDFFGIFGIGPEALSESDKDLPKGTGEGAGGIAEGRENFVPPREIYDYLVSKGVPDIHAKGMLANIQAESSFDSGAIGDNGTSGGLFQHHNTRFRAMKSAAGENWQENWKGQVDYALSEGDTTEYLSTQFSSAEDASKWFTMYWERPSNKRQKAIARTGNLKNFESFGSSAAPSAPKPAASTPKPAASTSTPKPAESLVPEAKPKPAASTPNPAASQRQKRLQSRRGSRPAASTPVASTPTTQLINSPTKQSKESSDYDIIIPLDHVPPNLSGKFPDDESKKSFNQSRATGADGRERQYQDSAARKLKSKLEKKGYKVGIVKPEDFSSYETYDNYITKQSKKDVRIVPLHFDASRSGGGTGFLTRTRSGDAEDAAFAVPIQEALLEFQRNNQDLGNISSDTQSNATVNRGAASPTALVELGVMVDWEKKYGKDFTDSSKFDKLIQGVADGIEKGTPLSTTQSSAKESSWQDRLRNRRSRSTASTVESEAKPIQIPKPIQSKLSSSTAKISESAEYEMGFDSKSPVVVMQSQKRTTPSSVNSGGGQMIPISISKKETLNSYYKSQIIGFLYKQG